MKLIIVFIHIAVCLALIDEIEAAAAADYRNRARVRWVTFFHMVWFPWTRVFIFAKAKK